MRLTTALVLACVAGVAATAVAQTPSALGPAPTTVKSPSPVGGSVPSTSAADGALLSAVTSALSADPALRGAQVSVTVIGGVVHLAGRARDRAQAERARSVAISAAGKARVQENILIR